MPLSRINAPLGSLVAVDPPRGLAPQSAVADLGIKDHRSQVDLRSARPPPLAEVGAASSAAELGGAELGGIDRQIFPEPIGREAHCYGSRPPISPSPCSAGTLGRSRRCRLRPRFFWGPARRNHRGRPPTPPLAGPGLRRG